MDVLMELSRILITELGDQQVIFLKEKDGQRSFPILIGIHEALAIDRRLKNKPTPRPMTHDLMAQVIESLGATIEKIVINDIQEHTFLATLYLRRDGQVIEVDSRPSDAIALGVAFDTPIYVAEHVLDSVVQAEPKTREARIGLLRQRLEMLSDRIRQANEQLSDENFLAQAPAEMVKELRRQCEEMQSEHDAIEKVLRKLG